MTELNMRIDNRLSELDKFVAKRGKPIRVGVVGTGQMGTGLAVQIGRLKGVSLSAIVSRNIDNTYKAAKRGGCSDIVEFSASSNDDIAAGKTVVSSDYRDLYGLDIDVIVESTGVPLVGAQIALGAIEAKKHIIMMSVETDVTVGLALAKKAEENGVIYTICDGDEPVCAKELYNLAGEMNLEVIAIGKGKNNPFRPQAVADELLEEAKSKNMNPRMLTSFVDGSKTMIEMATLSNALGIDIDVTAMHGPVADVDELATVLISKEEGGILETIPAVEYTFGPAPGVFAVVTTDDELVHEEMQYLGLGKGPYYTLYRPFHLASLEALRTIITTVMEERVTFRPTTWRTEVIATAKFDLEPGIQLEGIGGVHVRGVVHKAKEATSLLPVGLARGAKLLRPVKAGEPLSYDDVEITESLLTELRREQEALLGEES